MLCDKTRCEGLQDVGKASNGLDRQNIYPKAKPAWIKIWRNLVWYEIVRSDEAI